MNTELALRIAYELSKAVSESVDKKQIEDMVLRNFGVTYTEYENFILAYTE